MSGTRKKFNIHSRGTQDRLFCFILLLPAIILCITFIIIPIIEKNRLDICESVNTSLFASIFTFSVMSAPKYTP